MSAPREHPIARWMRVNKIKTQAEAGKRIGISQQEVSDYVTWKNMPRPKKMRLIAEAIGCHVGHLIPDVGREEGAA